MVLFAYTKIEDARMLLLYYIILYSSVSVCKLVVRIFSYIVTPVDIVSL